MLITANSSADKLPDAAQMLRLSASDSKVSVFQARKSSGSSLLLICVSYFFIGKMCDAYFKYPLFDKAIQQCGDVTFICVGEG